MLAASVPANFPIPFANSAGAGYIGAVPTASQISITPGAASLTDGFPPLCFTPVSAGGVPPFGKDFNGLLNQITANTQWYQAGGIPTYNSTFSTAIGGYPNGSVLQSADQTGFWRSAVDNNLTNPDTGGAGWLPHFAYGDVSITMTNANVTLTANQAAKSIIVITGTLTASLNLIFPVTVQPWLISNQTTGAYTITAKTASGTGVALVSGSQGVWGDGTNINSAFSPASISSIYLGTSTGSANAQVFTPTSTVSVYAVGVTYIGIFGYTNTGALQVNFGPGLINVYKGSQTGPVALTGGECVVGNIATFRYDGTRMQIATNSNTTTAIVSTAQSVASSNTGTYYVNTAAVTYTFAQSTVLGSNFVATIFAEGGAATIATNAGDTINGGSAGAGTTIPKGFIGTIFTNNSGALYLSISPAGSGISTIASATTTDLGTAFSTSVSITGTTTITSFGSSVGVAGPIYTLTFAGALTLTYGATSMILPTGANISTAAGDVAQFLSLGSGNWRCIDYQTASGQPLGSTNVPVRQTVLSGDTNASGQANFITTGSGLTPAFTATNPLVMTFANGFGSSGAVDFVSKITSGASLVAVPANLLSYLTAVYVSSSAVTWGSTQAPPQIGYSYNQAAQSSLTLNNNVLDDFGNACTSSGATFANASPKYAGTYYGVLTGSASSYFKTTAIPSLFTGNGSFTTRIAFYPAALANAGILIVQNAANYGLSISMTSAGKTCLYASSTGSSWDIFNNTNGSGTITAGAWHDLEFAYDAVAGKYYLYLDGVMDQSVSSASKICGATNITIGQGAVATTTFYFAGNVQGFEFKPYCQHPNGTTFTPQTTLASISTPGYASDWFDTTNMVMKSPSAASTVAGNNPTFTVSNKLYLGEATAGASTISSVVSYAFQGKYDQTFATTATGTSKAHNLGVQPGVSQLLLNGVTQSAAITLDIHNAAWTASVGTSRLTLGRGY